MTGLEVDPMKAYVDAPIPRQNQWEDTRDDPKPCSAPMGPAVVGVIPSATMVKKFTEQDPGFLAAARSSISFIWVSQ